MTYRLFPLCLLRPSSCLPAVTPAFPLLDWATLHHHLGTPIVTGITACSAAKAATGRGLEERNSNLSAEKNFRAKLASHSPHPYVLLVPPSWAPSSPSAHFPFASPFAASGSAIDSNSGQDLFGPFSYSPRRYTLLLSGLTSAPPCTSSSSPHGWRGGVEMPRLPCGAPPTMARGAIIRGRNTMPPLLAGKH